MHRVQMVQDSKNKQFIKVVSEEYLSWYVKEYVDESGFSSISYLKRDDECEMIFVRSGIFGLNKKQLARYFNDCPELAKKILMKKIKTIPEIVSFYNSWYSKQ